MSGKIYASNQTQYYGIFCLTRIPERLNNKDQTDSDNDIEGKDKFKERELKESSSHFPYKTLMDQTHLPMKLLI